VISSFLPLSGGAERQCFKLARALQRSDNLAWILTQQLSPDAVSAEVIDELPVKRVGIVGAWRRIQRRLRRVPRNDEQTSYEKALHRRGIQRSLYWLKQSCVQCFLALHAVAFLWRRRRSVSVLICFFFSPLEAIVCSLARRWGIPVIVRSANSRNYLFQELVGRWQRESLLSADRLIAISEDIRKELLALGVDQSRIRMIPNGVDVPTAQWDTVAPHRYAAICIANLSQQPLKGLDVLIEAWALVIRARGATQLLLGGGGNPSSLIKLAEHFGVEQFIEFAGSMRDVTSAMLQADVFVLPSRVEGMSNALLEAMALGMPCVVTAVSGNVDLIKNGRNGILVPPENPVALSDALLTLLHESTARVNLGREARRSIEMGYTTTHMLNRYRDVLSELDANFSQPAGMAQPGARAVS